MLRILGLLDNQPLLVMRLSTGRSGRLFRKGATSYIGPVPTRPPTTNTRPRSAALALAALAALAGLGTVAGCASDPPPTPAASIVLPTNPTSEPTPSDATPPVSATEPPTATRSSTPASGLSPIPPAARQRTARGAEAFVRYYIAESNRTMTHPRLGVMKPLEMPGCRACGNLERIVHALVERKVHYAANPTQIASMGEATEDPGTGDFVMSLLLQRPEVSVVHFDGRLYKTAPPASGLVAYRTRWRESGWALVEFTKIQ
ncbi:MAG: hypothetical protein IPL37_10260 [Austwickia sp.]|nr:hypothetical protein [Austwickia sp.]